MSAETLRRAVRCIREDYRDPLLHKVLRRFPLAVADMLEHEADHWEDPTHTLVVVADHWEHAADCPGCAHQEQALAVAKAYLREPEEARPQ